jgi:hypothetical protein
VRRGDQQLQGQDLLRIVDRRERPATREGEGEGDRGHDEDRRGGPGVAQPERDQQHRRDHQE